MLDLSSQIVPKHHKVFPQNYTDNADYLKFQWKHGNICQTMHKLLAKVA